MTVISFHGTGNVTLWQPSICHKNINNGTWLDHADFSSILENFGNSKIFRSVQNCDREWTEMIADDHVLNVEMPRFPNLFNISIFWHGSNANRSSLRYSYWFVNPVWNQITEKIFLLVPSGFNQCDCSMDIWKLYDPLSIFSIRRTKYSENFLTNAIKCHFRSTLKVGWNLKKHIIQVHAPI